MKSHRMGELTVRELETYLKGNQTVILPYGVVEQHGYHLPLDTDIRNAAVLGDKLAEALDCVVAPTLNYCFSGGMLTGTVNVKPNTFANLVGEIIESLAGQGFRNIIVLPGHGGSESLFHLKESLRILKWLNPALADVFIMLVPPWNFMPRWVEAFKDRDYHAGMVETSLLLAWCPEVVRGEIVLDETAVAERLRQDPDSYQERRAFTRSTDEIPQTSQRGDVKIGVMGHPGRASAELGRELTAQFIANAGRELGALLREVAEKRRSGERIELAAIEELRLLNL